MKINSKDGKVIKRFPGRYAILGANVILKCISSNNTRLQKDERLALEFEYCKMVIRDTLFGLDIDSLPFIGCEIQHVRGGDTNYIMKLGSYKVTATKLLCKLDDRCKEVSINGYFDPFKEDAIQPELF